MKSIRRRMMIIFSVACSAFILAAMLVTGIQTNNSTIELMNESRNMSAEFYSERAASWFSNVSSVLETPSMYMSQQASAEEINADAIRALNENFTARYDYATNIFSALADGSYFDGGGWIPDEGWSAFDGDWFTVPQKTGKTLYGSPYISARTGKVVMTISKPFYINGQVAGVVGMDISLDDLTDLMNEYSSSDEGYIVLVDSGGSIIMHNNSNFAPSDKGVTSINNAMDGDYITAAEDGSTMTDYDGSSAYVSSSPIGDTEWELYLVKSTASYKAFLAKRSAWLLSILLVSIAGMFVITFFVSKNIADPITKVKDMAVKMAEGNFNVDIKYNRDDEVKQLADSMRALCDNTNNIIADLGQILKGMEGGNLTTKSRDAGMYKGDYFNILTSVRNFRNKIIETLSNIDNASEQVLSGSEHVSSGAQGLSQGTTEQAASIEQLSATINNVNEKVNENAKSAEQAMEKTNEAGSEMQLATDKMNELVKAMSETKECSDQIGKIIKSIEDIAFQTNILALNAAVEAARAGSAGKGFAVVADEVRNLAAKSAEAASNTNTLIENTISSVDRGDKLVKEVADVMSMVSEAAGQVAVLNTSICDSSAELADSIAEINKGVEQISSVVQTNAATAQQSAAASEELSGQAHGLKGLVGEFTLK